MSDLMPCCESAVRPIFGIERQSLKILRIIDRSTPDFIEPKGLMFHMNEALISVQVNATNANATVMIQQFRPPTGSHEAQTSHTLARLRLLSNQNWWPLIDM